jgi:8-oxo-dGTP pyrophosphatase MutT (NUDIX family)
MLKMSTFVSSDQVRPSATVVVARAGSTSPEIFMVRRHADSSFGSAYAFPGGVVDPDDFLVNEYCRGLEDADANLRLGIAGGGLAYYSAAIRELFEESGLLLADCAGFDEDPADIRAALNEGTLSWADFVKQNSLALHCEKLNYVSHWITPEFEPKRYSTRFFVTALPTGQEANHCGGELTESYWVTATEMLAAERRGEVKMIFPTIKTLESIERHKTLDDLIEWAQSSVDWGITTMVPVAIKRDGKREIVLPGDRDYPGTKY